MSKVARQKQERVIEAVRNGLEGDSAAEFVRTSGYAMSVAGIARHLRGMGGRARVLDLLAEGKTNRESLDLLVPGGPEDDVDLPPPSQGELFRAEEFPVVELPETRLPAGFESTKITLKIPNELYEAIGLAAKAEDKSRAQLIIDILTTALANMPARHALESDAI
jgi:hypothetical protein